MLRPKPIQQIQPGQLREGFSFTPNGFSRDPDNPNVFERDYRHKLHPSNLDIEAPEFKDRAQRIDDVFREKEARMLELMSGMGPGYKGDAGMSSSEQELLLQLILGMEQGMLSDTYQADRELQMRNRI